MNVLSANIPSMPTKARQVLKEALSLPPRLARTSRVRFSSASMAQEAGVDAAWAAEVEQRVREVDSGSARLIPWERPTWATTSSSPPRAST